MTRFGYVLRRSGTRGAKPQWTRHMMRDQKVTACGANPKRTGALFVTNQPERGEILNCRHCYRVKFV